MITDYRDYIKTYDELIKIPGFQERLEYLLLYGTVAKDTFGYERYLNQILYKCPEWRKIRNEVIARDQANNLACDGFEINRYALVHHINPITVEDVMYRRPNVFDLNNLVTTNLATHNIIHYGSLSDVQNIFPVERTANDTCPWRKM